MRPLVFAPSTMILELALKQHSGSGATIASRSCRDPHSIFNTVRSVKSIKYGQHNFGTEHPDASGRAKEQKAEIKEAFDLFDTDGTGTIEVSEWQGHVKRDPRVEGFNCFNS